MIFRRDIPGWLHTNEVEQVKRIYKLKPFGKDIIEIGVFAGRTTQVIAQVCNDCNIYCIDPWRESNPPIEWSGMTDYTGPKFDSNRVYDIFKTEVANKYDRIETIIGYFPDDLTDQARTNIGMIYWDTDCIDDLPEMIKQFNAAWELLEPGGILGGHTFAWWMPNVVNVVREFAMSVNKDIILPPSGSIWYIIK